MPQARFEIAFPREGRSIQVGRGATLMDAAILCGLRIDAQCGGEGLCGKCRVRVSGDLEDLTPSEQALLDTGLVEDGWRLACQARPLGDCEVDTGLPASWAEAKVLISPRRALEVDLDPAAGGVERPVGAAVDVGTTTLCVSLIDLSSGSRLAVVSSENPQVRFGADVMTRIERCRSHPAATDEMHRLVSGSIDLLVAEAAAEARVPDSSVIRMVMVGNTTMMHLALGEDPSSLGTAPFQPAVKGPVRERASLAGFESVPRAELLVPPVLSGFLGTDILAVALASLGPGRETTLMIDLGTNGEIALSNSDRILACSTAAGPAFEGAEISSGMRAVPGAIESMSRDGKFQPGVLGGGTPAGICGSGLLDTVAAMIESGLVARSGRIAEPGSVEGVAPGRVRQSGDLREFVLAPGTEITLTQDDIRQLQLAKGAVRAGIEVLCSRSGTGYDDIESVRLAGAFGNFLKPGAAVTIGLIPRELHSRVVFAGNAALDGAEMMLTSERRWDEALALAGSIDVIELSGERSFQKAFIGSLSFP